MLERELAAARAAEFGFARARFHADDRVGADVARLLGEPVQSPSAHLVQRLRERVELDQCAAAVSSLAAPRGLVAHLVDRAAHHLRERRQPELVAEREAVDGQVGRERRAAPALLTLCPAQLAQAPLGRQWDAARLDPRERLLPARAPARRPRPVRPPSQRTSPSSAVRASALRCASACSSSVSAAIHASGSSGSRLIAIPPDLRSRKPSTRSPSISAGSGSHCQSRARPGSGARASRRGRAGPRRGARRACGRAARTRAWRRAPRPRCAGPCRRRAGPRQRGRRSHPPAFSAGYRDSTAWVGI